MDEKVNVVIVWLIYCQATLGVCRYQRGMTGGRGLCVGVGTSRCVRMPECLGSGARCGYCVWGLMIWGH